MKLIKQFTTLLVALLLFLGHPLALKAALTKTRTSLYSAQTLTAGAGDTTSSTINNSTGYQAILSITLTNGATGPTVPAQCIVQTANDTAGTLFVNYTGPLTNSVANNAVGQWTVVIPLGSNAFRTVCGSNTAQNVTLNADYVMVTGL